MMMTSRDAGLWPVLRAVRTARNAGLDTVAAAHDSTVDVLRSGLRRLDTRGGCADTIVGAVKAAPFYGDGSNAAPPHETTAKLVSQHPGCPPGIRRCGDWPPPGPTRRWGTAALRTAATDPNPNTRFAAHADPDVPPILLEIAARDPQPMVRLAAASHRWCSPTAAVRAAADTDVFVRKGLAQGSGNRMLLDMLARDRAGIVRDRAVNNPNISAATLRHTAGDIDSVVRASTAAHPNCEPATIAELATDPDPDVRRHSAYNQRCTQQTLRALATDPDPDVRAAVAMHPDCAPRTLIKLVASPAPAVVAAIRRGPLAATPASRLARLTRIAVRVITKLRTSERPSTG